jgi:hypothetical protein
MPRLRFPDPSEEFLPSPIGTLDPFLGDGRGKVYLRILGSNGAGKSAFGRALRASDPEAFSFIGEDGKTRLGTVFPNFGWAAVGYYTGRGGGADRLDKKEWIFESLFRLAGTTLHIFIEGMTVTNARERYWEADLAFAQNFGRKALLVHLDYSLEECLRRIYARNGGKKIEESYVDEIHRRVRKTAQLYEERIAAGAPILLHRESTLGVEAMVASLIEQTRSVYGADVFLRNGEDVGRTESRPVLRNVVDMEYDISTATPVLREQICEDYKEWVRVHPKHPRKGPKGPPGFLGPKYGFSAKRAYHFSMLFKHPRAEEYRARFIAGESLDALWCEYKESGAMRGEPKSKPQTKIVKVSDEPPVEPSEKVLPAPSLVQLSKPLRENGSVTLPSSNAWKPRTDPAYLLEFETLHKEAFKEYQKALRPLANKCGGMINIHYQLCQRLSRGNGWWKIVLKEEQSFTDE